MFSIKVIEALFDNVTDYTMECLQVWPAVGFRLQAVQHAEDAYGTGRDFTNLRESPKINLSIEP